MDHHESDLPFMRYTHSILCEESDDEIIKKCHALASPERLCILRMLYRKPMLVMELAHTLYMSVSTVTFHLKILQDAGLIEIILTPGKRGRSQLCQCRFTSLTINTEAKKPDRNETVVREIPVGLYTGAQMKFVSGFCTADEQILFDDGDYFTPYRANALLLWASGGYVEYSISNTRPTHPLKRITFSVELCSETLNYQLGWKSDITFWLNGRELCTYTSPSDFGGRRGSLNPAWWSDASTQYGELKEISVTAEGVLIDGEPVPAEHPLTVSDFDGCHTFVLRIGNKPDAKYKGGFNLFGRGFGDHMQDIRLEITYHVSAQ